MTGPRFHQAGGRESYCLGEAYLRGMHLLRRDECWARRLKDLIIHNSITSIRTPSENNPDYY